MLASSEPAFQADSHGIGLSTHFVFLRGHLKKLRPKKRFLPPQFFQVAPQYFKVASHYFQVGCRKKNQVGGFIFFPSFAKNFSPLHLLDGRPRPS
jgi:hypothetical protein